MTHKCEQHKRVKNKRAFFVSRSRGKATDVVDVKLVLMKMKMLNQRPTKSFLMRHGLLHRRPRLQQSSGAQNAT